jgi:hypothetical protein
MIFARYKYLQQFSETGEDRDADVGNNWTARIPPGKGVGQPHKFQSHFP